MNKLYPLKQIAKINGSIIYIGIFNSHIIHTENIGNREISTSCINQF